MKIPNKFFRFVALETTAHTLARKKKHVLHLEIEIDFAIIAISSHQKDFKLSWSINSSNNWKLKKEEDVFIVPKTSTAQVPFSLYSYFDEEIGCEFLLIVNKHRGHQILPEIKGADYLLILRGAYNQELIAHTIEQLKSTLHVLTAFEVDPNKIVNKQNLYFLL